MVYGTKILIYLAIATLMLPASVRVGCCCDNQIESTEQAAESQACPHCVKANSFNTSASSDETINHDCRCQSQPDRTVLIASSPGNKDQNQTAAAWNMNDSLTGINHKLPASFAQHSPQGHSPGVLQSILCRWTT
ncbi:MAG: hypothetical protein COA78_26555 [Blastopirellula sp.]|nr:MAG: hypothetical protein COA78_26555 [Blastopirellula sp.]